MSAMAAIGRQLDELVALAPSAPSAMATDDEIQEAVVAATRSLQALCSTLQQQPNQRKVFLSFCGSLLGPSLACRSKFASLSVRDDTLRSLERAIDQILGAVLFHEQHMTGTRERAERVCTSQRTDRAFCRV